MIAVALDAGFDIGGIRRRYRRLGHQEGGTDFAIHQRPKPLLLVLLGAIPHQHFHVAGIGRGAIEYFRSPADVAHLLGERSVFQIGQSRAAEFVVLMRRRRHEHVPQAFGARLFLEFFQDRDRLPALALGVLLLVDRHRGPDMLVHERFHTVEPFALTVRHVEVHWAFLTFLGENFGGTVSPRPVHRKTIYRKTTYRACQRGGGGRRGIGRSGDASCALTFRPSNHSFIQLFEMQLRQFAVVAWAHDMPSDHTRTAILSAAERLYADRGFADVTLRDIVAAADVNLAAVNYHFGSKDELIAELFVTRSLATNRERLNELKAAEAAGGGRANIDSILRALVGPTLRGCLGPDRERSAAARFMIRASIESVPPIRRIKNREIDHLRKFAAAMRRSLPDRSEVELYWGLHFALAMAHQTIRDGERLTKLSEGLCDLNDVTGIIDRIVTLSVKALTGGEGKIVERVNVQRAR